MVDHIQSLGHAHRHGHGHTHAQQALPGGMQAPDAAGAGTPPTADSVAAGIIATNTTRAKGFDAVDAALDVFRLVGAQRDGTAASIPSATDVANAIAGQLSPARRGAFAAAIQNGGQPPAIVKGAEADAAADAGGDLRPNAPVTAADPEGRRLIGRREGVSPGNDSFTVQDAYDMSVFAEADGSYTAAVKTRVEYAFRDSEAASWTEESRTRFVDAFEGRIESTWDGHVLGRAPDGGEIRLDIDIDSRLAGTGEQWTANVTAITPGSFDRSAIFPGLKTAKLDSEDVTPVSKGAPERQTGAAHEFGHMIGLVDEYLPGAADIDDRTSIMHSGDTVRPRHLSNLAEIANAILAQ